MNRAVSLMVAACALTGSSSAQVASPPLGLDVYMRVPADNLVTLQKVALGERLFFDTQLSVDGSLSCAACHQPSRAFTDGRPRSRGVLGRRTTRSAPSIVNAGYGTAFFWDGRTSSLEEQVLKPIQAREEMGANLETVVARLRSSEDYRVSFRSVFGDTVTAETIGKALATFVRTRRSAASAVDRYADGDRSAIDEDAAAGLRVFQGRARCVECHHGPLLSDGQFHNTGIGWGGPDAGRMGVTGHAGDRGRFKTPSLRNVAITAPYMHDGSLATLEDVIEFYGRGAKANPNLDQRVRPLELSADEKRQLLAYLRALTSAEYAGAS